MRVPFTATLQTSPREWLAFSDPVLVLQADAADAVRRTIADVEQLTRDRELHAVGFLTYEAGAAFGLTVRTTVDPLPPAWFALYHPSTVVPVSAPARTGAYALGALSPSVDAASFGRSMRRIKEHLAAGDTYQVNYTFRMGGTVFWRSIRAIRRPDRGATWLLFRVSRSR
ncbi:MAG: hypothetical protein QM736_11750 [Vicinamibacterales bacterium]